MFHWWFPPSLKSEPSLPTPPGTPAPSAAPGSAEDRACLKAGCFPQRENVDRVPSKRFSGPCGSQPGRRRLPATARGQAPSLEEPPHLLAAAGLGVSQHPPGPSGAGLTATQFPEVRLRPAPGQPGAGDQAWHVAEIVVGQPRSRASVHPVQEKFNRGCLHGTWYQQQQLLLYLPGRTCASRRFYFCSNSFQRALWAHW